jgi:hypothetical protein
MPDFARFAPADGGRPRTLALQATDAAQDPG